MYTCIGEGGFSCKGPDLCLTLSFDLEFYMFHHPVFLYCMLSFYVVVVFV